MGCKFTVRASCGHSYDAEISGSEEEQAKKVRWIETEGLCPLCYRERQDRCRSEKAEILEGALSLPPLMGSEKQVRWARGIRAEMIDGLLDDYPDELDMDGLALAIRKKRPGTEVFYERNARYWIDNREKTLNGLMSSWKKERAANRPKLAIG